MGRGCIAAAVVLWRRGCRLRGKGLFAAGLLLASAGYVALIDKAAPFEADRYYVVIYAAVVLAVAVVLARLAPQHETLLLLALVPILAAHWTDPNAYLYEDAARALRWPTPEAARRCAEQGGV